MLMNDLPVFANLSEEFIANIQIACVLNVHMAVVVNNEDNVYSIINDNCHRIDILCKRQFHLFAHGIRDNGYGHVIALNRNGQIFGWGLNHCNQVNGSDEEYVNIPKEIPINSKVIQIECGSLYSMALTEDGHLYAWGNNDNGQIGNGTSNVNVKTPFKVEINENSKITSIACGTRHSLALLDNGNVYGWGFNGSGELGLGSNDNQLKPCHVKSLNRIKKIVCGLNHTLALDSDGKLFTMGMNDYGQLGNGNNKNQNLPVKIDMKFIEIIAFGSGSGASTANGSHYAWGQCSNIPLGDIPIELPNSIDKYTIENGKYYLIKTFAQCMIEMNQLRMDNEIFKEENRHLNNQLIEKQNKIDSLANEMEILKKENENLKKQNEEIKEITKSQKSKVSASIATINVSITDPKVIGIDNN